jgi:hypothetical protein
MTTLCYIFCVFALILCLSRYLAGVEVCPLRVRGVYCGLSTADMGEGNTKNVLDSVVVAGIV